MTTTNSKFNKISTVLRMNADADFQMNLQLDLG